MDVPSAVLAELVRRSMSIERPRLPSPTNERDPRGSAPDLRINADESASPTQSSLPLPTTTVHAVDIVVAHSTPTSNTPDLRRRLSDTSVEEVNSLPLCFFPVAILFNRYPHRNLMSLGQIFDVHFYLSLVRFLVVLEVFFHIYLMRFHAKSTL